MAFELFDPKADVRITAGNLPHWFQPGVTYFITFRTDDSFPVAVARRWHGRRDEWLRKHGINPGSVDWASKLRALPDDQLREFHTTFSHEFMEHLDRGHGECVLKRPEIARIVTESFHHLDGQRYRLGDFVVMPNHVHLLVCLFGATDPEGQCYSWKKFTSTRINKVLERRGRFWHEESFDHLVRSPEQFECLRTYIADNPKRAGLLESEYVYWRWEEK